MQRLGAGRDTVLVLLSEGAQAEVQARPKEHFTAPEEKKQNIEVPQGGVSRRQL